MVSRTAHYFLFEVTVDNGFKGTKFILKGNEIYPALGFHKRYVVIAMRGGSEVEISGFKIKLIHEKEAHLYHHGLPKKVAALRKKNKRYGQSHVVPVIGTVNIGVYAGLEFSFFGSQDIPAFFSQGVISSVINGKIKQHKGCGFRVATHREAMPYHGKFTQAVEDDLSQYNFVIKPIVAIPLRGLYKGIEYPLISANKVKEFFTTATARAIATGYKTSYKGFVFKNVSYADIKGNTNTLSKDIFDETADALKVPYVGKIIKGELAGREFGFIYKSVIEKYLVMRLVQAVVRGDRSSYKGCIFNAATYEEALALTENFTPEIADYLNARSRP